ncbi:hypothetical protein L211DRAFT_408289 [Terfezia boudieri ATCC MYA-4762]|uniref:Uncharacterized protein n=1 Tax=Terfezia boudieri ATCC MYA-4762 TaxID=1051890 RepID=A0A3N4LKC9_9PEZI|nr:hypothetical protein L211DRAFT_408289 [Terfezia boudieri ATCC MYA-4762]
MTNKEGTAISGPTGLAEDAPASDTSPRIPVGRAPDTDTIPAVSSNQFDTNDNNGMIDLHDAHLLHTPYAALLSNPCHLPEVDQPPAIGELQDEDLFGGRKGPFTQTPTSTLETNPVRNSNTMSPTEPRPPRVPFLDLANYKDQWVLSPAPSVPAWRYFGMAPPTIHMPQQSQARFRALNSRFGAYAPIAYLDVGEDGIRRWRFPPAEELIRILDSDPAKRPLRRMPKGQSKYDKEEFFWFGDAVYTRSDAEAIL